MPSSPRVAIVDYGAGNLFSVQMACAHVGLHGEVTSQPADVFAAIRAGFSERTANEQASQMLAKPHIEAEVTRLQVEAAAANNIAVATLLITQAISAG